jgi:hypothetical protein
LCGSVETVGVEFLCYHRDRPGSLPLREQLVEEHWSYMDRYAAEMIARGPTLADDGDTPTSLTRFPGRFRCGDHAAVARSVWCRS